MSAPLVAIVGATAAGKTALAVALAQRLDGEIINADSRQVYRGMDIGTAKPSPAELAAARHWLIDVADPDEQFTLAAFLDGARAAIADIRGRRRVHIVAGGTGQYVWALLEGWSVPRVAPDPALRAELEDVASTRGVSALVALLREVDAAALATIDTANPRRLIRAIEVTRATGRPYSEQRTRTADAISATIIGLRRPRADLYARIDARVDAMLDAGLVDEVRSLVERGCGCDLPSMSGIGYRQVCEYLRGECDLPAAVARIKTETHRLARMQHTWFRDDDSRIAWLEAAAPDTLDAALHAIASGG